MNAIRLQITLALATPILVISMAARAADLVRMQINTGRQLFATTSTNCHGSEGKGGTAPALVDRNLPLELMASTIVNGRPGTAMPPFKDVLDEIPRAEVLAYVQWLSSGGRLPTKIVTAESFGPAASVPAMSAPSDTPVLIGDARGVPARGAALFFDPTNLSSCHTCHSYREEGGPLGPDLCTLEKTPFEYSMSPQYRPSGATS